MVNKLGCKKYSGARAHYHHQINRLRSSRLLVISNWLGLGQCSTCMLSSSEKCLLGSIHSCIVIGWKRTSAVSLAVLSYGRAHTTNQGNSIFNHVQLFVCLVPLCISHPSIAFLYHMTYQLQINEFLRGLIRWGRGGGGGGVNTYQTICCKFSGTNKKGPQEVLSDRGWEGGCRQGCIEDLL